LLDQEATQRAIDFRIGWYVHTLCLTYTMGVSTIKNKSVLTLNQKN
jgi:hypothetical protein